MCLLLEVVELVLIKPLSHDSCERVEGPDGKQLGIGPLAGCARAHVRGLLKGEAYARCYGLSYCTFTR